MYLHACKSSPLLGMIKIFDHVFLLSGLFLGSAFYSPLNFSGFFSAYQYFQLVYSPGVLYLTPFASCRFVVLLVRSTPQAASASVFPVSYFERTSLSLLTDFKHSSLINDPSSLTFSYVNLMCLITALIF